MKKKHGRGYKFTLKKYKQSSIMSAVAGLISFATIITIIILAFLQKGEVTLSQTLTSMVITVVSMAGLTVAILCISDKEQYHLFSKIGLIFNGLTIVIMAYILYLGVI